jgi:hypothetical protein
MNQARCFIGNPSEGANAMFTRRQFLAHGSAALMAGAALADDTRDGLPDGSASKGMITAEAEQAIKKGLSYLDSRRHRDGGYGSTQNYQGNVAITSLAALAFMASGSQPGRGPYGKAVTDCLEFVLNQEDARLPGYLLNKNGAGHGPMYGHGFGTLFLAEVHGMVSDKRLRTRVKDTLKRAVEVIIASQNKEGGWRYFPTPKDADISVTICQIMALRSARNAGIAVPKKVVDNCVQYVKKCQDRDTGSFRYQMQGIGPGHGQTFARTAAGVCALYSAGIYKGREIDMGLKHMMQFKPPSHFPRFDMHYFYGHYYAVQAMWTAGGNYWTEWFPSIRDELVGNQKQDGHWDDTICVHYGTAMACIILQVPNNYLPILQK